MTTYNLALSTVNITAITIMLVSDWYLAKGILRPVYCLGILTATLFGVESVMMFVHDADQWSTLLMNIVNVNVLVASASGLRRLAREGG